jgi:hypothetical protein
LELEASVGNGAGDANAGGNTTCNKLGFASNGWVTGSDIAGGLLAVDLSVGASHQWITAWDLAETA